MMGFLVVTRGRLVVMVGAGHLGSVARRDATSKRVSGRWSEYCTFPLFLGMLISLWSVSLDREEVRFGLGKVVMMLLWCRWFEKVDFSKTTLAWLLTDGVGLCLGGGWACDSELDPE